MNITINSATFFCGPLLLLLVLLIILVLPILPLMPLLSILLLQPSYQACFLPTTTRILVYSYTTAGLLLRLLLGYVWVGKSRVH